MISENDVTEEIRRRVERDLFGKKSFLTGLNPKEAINILGFEEINVPRLEMDLTDFHYKELYNTWDYIFDNFKNHNKKSTAAKHIGKWLRFASERHPDCLNFVYKCFEISRDHLALRELVYGPEFSAKIKEAKGKRMSGSNNPGYQHGGRNSPFSKKFIKYENLSEEEKEEKLKETYRRTEESRKENFSHTTTLEYYMYNKGMTREEAEEALSERQATKDLVKLIEKYGEEEGKRRHREITKKWYKSYWLNKSVDEKKRIHAQKGGNNVNSINEINFYILKLVITTGEIVYKIGVATDPLKRKSRIERLSIVDHTEFLESKKTTFENAIEMESLLVEEYWDQNVLTKDEFIGIGESQLNTVETFFLEEDQLSAIREAVRSSL